MADRLGADVLMTGVGRRTTPLAAAEPSSAGQVAEVRARVARSRRREVVIDKVLKVVSPLVVALLLGLLWQWWAADIDSLMIPLPAETFSALQDIAVSGELWSALATTGQPLLLGYVLVILLGLPIGIGMAQSRTFERVADVYVSILLVTPMAAIIPIAIMATGLTLTTRTLVVLSFALPMVIVNTRAGVKGVDVSTEEMARCFGARRRQVWGRIIIPSASPGIVTGLRLALSRGVTGTLVIELLLIPVGVGGLILDYRGSFRAPELWATVIAMVLVSLALLSALKVGEKLLFPWATRKELE